MNASEKLSVNIRISALYKYTPVIKAIAASLFSIRDVDYPWEPWLGTPCGKFEREDKVFVQSSFLSKAPNDKVILEGVLETNLSCWEVISMIATEIQDYYGEQVCSVEACWI